jgi:hypothetical protein
MPVELAAVVGSTAVDGVLGTAVTWVASTMSTGNRVAGREAQTPRLVGACERQVRWGGGGQAALLGLQIDVSRVAC